MVSEGPETSLAEAFSSQVASHQNSGNTNKERL
jgi:hypothetical protein